MFCSRLIVVVILTRSCGLQLQGGIHPEFTGETYLEILKAVKKAVPEMHVHAFSPLEVFQGAFTLGIR
jgi:FO synthase